MAPIGGYQLTSNSAITDLISRFPILEAGGLFFFTSQARQQEASDRALSRCIFHMCRAFWAIRKRLIARIIWHPEKRRTFPGSTLDTRGPMTFGTRIFRPQ